MPLCADRPRPDRYAVRHKVRKLHCRLASHCRRRSGYRHLRAAQPVSRAAAAVLLSATIGVLVLGFGISLAADAPSSAAGAATARFGRVPKFAKSPTAGSPTAGAHSAPHHARAIASRVISIKEEAHLSFANSSGEALLERGRGQGTFNCLIVVHLILNGITVKSTFTAYPRGGSLTGHATGNLSSTTGAYASFSGALSFGQGTGRYARASGFGTIYGAVDRRNYALTVQVIGKMHA
jgi:hypothetical protein